MFGRYGVRVPAIVVSPWVEPRSVSSTVFDHTSIIKSVLLRFCPQALNPPAETRSWRLRTYHPQHPGARVAHAAHLGELLTRTAPRPAPPRDPLVTGAAARAAEQAKRGNDATGQAGPGEHEHTDLQKGFLAAAHELTRWGHPAGKP
jgi:phospholipase C